MTDENQTSNTGQNHQDKTPTQKSDKTRTGETTKKGEKTERGGITKIRSESTSKGPGKDPLDE